MKGHYNDKIYVNGIPYNADTLDVTVSMTLSPGLSGKTFFIATDALTVTLPACRSDTYGVTYTIINSGADGNNIITVDPNASDAIHGAITMAAADFVAAGTDGTAIVNTKASSTTGDYVMLRSNGVDWFIIGGSGIWA